jgi:hypothetical protein
MIFNDQLDGPKAGQLAKEHGNFTLLAADEGVNFCRTHQTLRVTPAMAAGVTDHVWDIAELLESKCAIN